MPEFLIDANLPSRISIWQNSRFIHIAELNPAWDDETVWEYAGKNNLTIVSKDKDFLLLQLLKGVPPKIVHIKFGNLKLNQLISIIETNWQQVEYLLKDHTLVNIYIDKIEAIK